jgi:HAMP domain-containing protein
MTSPKLGEQLKVSLDELRMQMLGAQVLFGFQLQSLFQPGFAQASQPERLADALTLAAILVSFAALLAAPAQHRLVERGEASSRLIRLSKRCAEFALGTMGLALGSISYAIALHAEAAHPWITGLAASALALLGWFGLGVLLRPSQPARPARTEFEKVDLHHKIEQMLTEARVVLPGVQALLGFQLIVVMTQAFERLPHTLQQLHFVSLAVCGLTVVLLLAPAAVHRIAFAGEDDERFHTIGTILISIALVPLALSIAADVLIATWKLFNSTAVAAAGACAALTLFLLLWYGVPLLLRRRGRFTAR